MEKAATDSLKTVTEQAAQMNTLYAMSDEALKTTFLDEEDAAAFLGYKKSALAHKRAEQNNLPEDQRDPQNIGSIPAYPGGTTRYRLYDLLEFLKKQQPVKSQSRPRSEETLRKTAETKAKSKEERERKEKERRAAAAQGLAAVAARQGFPAFMQTATGVDRWPFSIQKDGRPMDLFTATLDQKLTGRAQRLTLREFGTMLADAAGQSYADDEREAMAALIPQPGSKPEPAATMVEKNGKGSRRKSAGGL